MKSMKVGIIAKPNEKGQIVIPKEIRDALGIDASVPLNMSVRSGGIYLYPIVEVFGVVDTESSYMKLLGRTKGAWSESWSAVRKKRSAVEHNASKRRRRIW